MLTLMWKVWRGMLKESDAVIAWRVRVTRGRLCALACESRAYTQPRPPVFSFRPVSSTSSSCIRHTDYRCERTLLVFQTITRRIQCMRVIWFPLYCGLHFTFVASCQLREFKTLSVLRKEEYLRCQPSLPDPGSQPTHIGSIKCCLGVRLTGR